MPNTLTGAVGITVRNSDKFFAPKDIRFWKKQTVKQVNFILCLILWRNTKLDDGIIRSDGSGVFGV